LSQRARERRRNIKDITTSDIEYDPRFKRRANVKTTKKVRVPIIRNRATREMHHKVRGNTMVREGPIPKRLITMLRGGQYVHNKG
jgi:hypothetical protein